MVPSQFPEPGPTARIAFVGEAPSDDEVEKGKPFVGPAGRIFNAMLRSANLAREDYFVGNVFSEQLPENNVKHWTANAKEAREGGFDGLPPVAGGYLRPEFYPHLARLDADLARVRPNVIVPLGDTALWALTAREGISRMRGAVTRATRVAKGTKLLPTYHPAFVMRQWKFYSVVVGDFIKASQEADLGPEIVYPKRRLMVAPSLAEVEDHARACMRASLLSVDIETAFGQITSIGLAPNVREGMCIPFVDWSQPNRCYWATPEAEYRAWEAVRGVLESPVPKLGQNFCGYDAMYLYEKKGIRVMNLLHDTRLLHHALYPELPKDLAFMGGSYTSLGPWKNMRDGKDDKRDA